jgi:hypothetical protein
MRSALPGSSAVIIGICLSLAFAGVIILGLFALLVHQHYGERKRVKLLADLYNQLNINPGRPLNPDTAVNMQADNLAYDRSKYELNKDDLRFVGPVLGACVLGTKPTV